MNNVVNAIKSLRPGKRFSFLKDNNGNQTLEPEYLDWLDNDPTTKPSVIEINEEIRRLESIAYQEKRAAEYPSLGDQLDDLFKAGMFSAEMTAQIQAVKDKYPKA